MGFGLRVGKRVRVRVSLDRLLVEFDGFFVPTGRKRFVTLCLQFGFGFGYIRVQG